MSRKWVVFFLFKFILLSAIFFADCKVHAQMTIEYPKRFSFSGIIDLSYRDYFYELPSVRKKAEYHTSFLEQTYGIGVRGFIYHPRLAVFTSGIKFRDIRQLAGVGGKTNTQVFGYDFLLTFLPYRPISLEIFGGNDDYKINPEGSFINPQWAGTHKINYNYYGARLKINKPPLPFTRLEYDHEENDLLNLGNNAGKITTDEYTLDIRGNLRFWNTVYLGFLQYADFTSPSLSYKAKYIRFSLSSTIKPGLYLQNYFNYSDIDFSKLLTFNSQLNINHHERYNQYYSYNFYRTQHKFAGLEEQGIPGAETKETIHSMTGAWSYRFPNRIHSSLSLNYGLRNDEIETTKFYGANFGLSYARPFYGFNFSPKYRLLFRKDENRGELFENNIELDFVTRKLRWGTWYTNYALIISKERQKFKHKVEDEFGFEEEASFGETKVFRITHSLRTGIRGRGPGKRLTRAQWNVEGELYYSRAKIERPRRESLFGDDEEEITGKTEKFEREISRYTLTGDVSYPLGWATFFFSAGFSYGESNSISFKRFFYEERLDYPIMRHLRLSFQWKELWENFEGTADEKIREYVLLSEYRLGRIALNLEGRILRATADGKERYVRRLFLRLRRFF